MRCLGHALGSDEFCSEFYTETAERTVDLVKEIIKVADYSNPSGQDAGIMRSGQY